MLVTGPTGSGKSTTLASLIDVINATREEHIMTIEDPIEFLHQHKKCIVNQRELGSDATSFAEALKAALRQDPDVILVGEMRDLETIGDRDHRGGDRPPRVRDAAHAGHAADDRPHHRRVPGRAAGPDPRAARRSALQGIMTQQLLPTADGAGRCVAAEVLVPDAGRAQPDPRGQDAPDLLGAADRRRARDADDGRLARRSSCARARSPASSPSRAPRTPEELRRLLGGGAGGPADERWRRRSAMATYVFKAIDLAGVPARRARSRRDSKQAVADQLKERGLVVVDIAAKHRSKELNIDAVRARQGRRPDGDLAPARDDGRLRA